jgi:hypothetical protein
VTPREAWGLLALAPDSDTGAVRRAYADRLRAMDPDADPAGFARLRMARDAALAAAARGGADQANDDPFGDIPVFDNAAPVPAPEWPHAAPRLDLPPGDVRSAGLPDHAPPRPTAGTASGPAEAPLVIATDPLAIPVLDRTDHGEILSDRNRAAALRQLLTSDAVTAPLDDPAEARAHSHLAVLLRLSGTMPIEQSRALEDWIADLLAQTWPRSAPLLEPAANAFGWAGEHGQIGERPALVFLNARLRGLQFSDDVMQPGHRFHKVWVELSKPGSKRGLGVRTRDVKTLLEGIRKDFPEVERYLNADRVGAWDRKIDASSSPRSWIGNHGSFVILLLVFGLRFAILLANWHPGHISRPAAYPDASDDNAQATLALDAGAQHWFAPGASLASVAQSAPLVARLAIRNAGGTTDMRAADMAMRSAVLTALHLAAWQADPDVLRAIQTLRLHVLDTAAQAGPSACYDFMARNSLDDDVELSPEDSTEARRLVASLARDGKLTTAPAAETLAAPVPGKVIAGILASTHLPLSVVQQALHRQGSDENQCSVKRALLRETLRLPIAQGIALLHIE